MNLIAKGHSRAQQFSWMRSAEIYLRLMAKADGIGHDGRSEHH
jgi:hypothetical protein